MENFEDIGRVEAIESLYKGTGFKPFQGAGFDPGARGSVVTAARMFTEGVDFDLVYFPLKHLGYKCVTAVTGELLAALATPRALTVRIAVSAKLDFPQVRELWQGMVAAATEHGYKAVDLDLLPSRNGLLVSVSAAGELPKLTAARRPAPQTKDLLCLSGSVGGAYFGLRVLDREKRCLGAGEGDGRFRVEARNDENNGARNDGRRAAGEGGFKDAGDNAAKDGAIPTPSATLERYRMMVGSYLKPEISPYVVPQMIEDEMVPSASVLVDRGLADAVKRIARATGLGAKVYADRIPFEGQSFDLGKALDVDPISAAMNGGEDYRLLFTIPILKAEQFRRDFQTFEIIGHLALPEAGTTLVSPDGLEHALRAQGWPDA